MEDSDLGSVSGAAENNVNGSAGTSDVLKLSRKRKMANSHAQMLTPRKYFSGCWQNVTPIKMIPLDAVYNAEEKLKRHGVIAQSSSDDSSSSSDSSETEVPEDRDVTTSGERIDLTENEVITDNHPSSNDFANEKRSEDFGDPGVESQESVSATELVETPESVSLESSTITENQPSNDLDDARAESQKPVPATELMENSSDSVCLKSSTTTENHSSSNDLDDARAESQEPVPATELMEHSSDSVSLGSSTITEKLPSNDLDDALVKSQEPVPVTELMEISSETESQDLSQGEDEMVTENEVTIENQPSFNDVANENGNSAVVKDPRVESQDPVSSETETISPISTILTQNLTFSCSDGFFNEIQNVVKEAIKEIVNSVADSEESNAGGGCCTDVVEEGCLPVSQVNTLDDDDDTSPTVIREETNFPMISDSAILDAEDIIEEITNAESDALQCLNKSSSSVLELINQDQTSITSVDTLNGFSSSSEQSLLVVSDSDPPTPTNGNGSPELSLREVGFGVVMQEYDLM